jgi:hypothetical protein
MFEEKKLARDMLFLWHRSTSGADSNLGLLPKMKRPGVFWRVLDGEVSLPPSFVE